MIYTGRMKGGKVIFDGDHIPEDGTAVRIKAIDGEFDDAALSKALLKLAGSVEGLPEDVALNVDHYLYGVPKK